MLSRRNGHWLHEAFAAAFPIARDLKIDVEREEAVRTVIALDALRGRNFSFAVEANEGFAP